MAESKKMPDFRDSLWANELQEQWEKDRSKKAAKKQQRAAARQAADYDPYPNTHGHYNSTKLTKKQRRLENRQRRAQLKSLADHAEDGQVVAQAPKSFADICAYIDEFLLDETHTTLTLPPLGKRDRAVVHNMAGAYALKSKSHGKGTERFPVLMKTSRTGHSVDYSRLKRLSRIPFALSEREWDAHPGLGGGGVRIEVGRRHKDGTHVGKGAKQISEDNIGHKLLRSMGWSSGQGIGQAGGRTEPVQATVKITRSGLGM